MSHTVRKNDKPWYRKWPDAPGVGRAYKTRFHRAMRRVAREEIDAQLYGTRIRARGLRNAAGDVNYRGT